MKTKKKGPYVRRCPAFTENIGEDKKRPLIFSEASCGIMHQGYTYNRCVIITGKVHFNDDVQMQPIPPRRSKRQRQNSSRFEDFL